MSHGFKPPLPGLYFSHVWYVLFPLSIYWMNCISFGNKEYFIVIIVIIFSCRIPFKFDYLLLYFYIPDLDLTYSDWSVRYIFCLFFNMFMRNRFIHWEISTVRACRRHFHRMYCQLRPPRLDKLNIWSITLHLNSFDIRITKTNPSKRWYFF